jgi:hypothetical protein
MTIARKFMRELPKIQRDAFRNIDRMVRDSLPTPFLLLPAQETPQENGKGKELTAMRVVTEENHDTTRSHRIFLTSYEA